MFKKFNFLLTFICSIVCIQFFCATVSTALPLPGIGEEFTTGTFEISLGETATLIGKLSGDAILLNYGNLNVSDTGEFADMVKIQNNGSISGELKLVDTVQLQNNGQIETLYQTDNSTAQISDTGEVTNVRLLAKDDDTVNIQINGTVGEIDADVYSSGNSGFININVSESGSVGEMDILDNVPTTLGTNILDLITLQNYGNIETLYGDTEGNGQLNLFNIGGSIESLSTSGNANVWWASGSIGNFFASGDTMMQLNGGTIDSIFASDDAQFQINGSSINNISASGNNSFQVNTTLGLEELILQNGGDFFNPTEWILSEDSFSLGDISINANSGTLIVNSPNPPPVPEPSTILLFGLGILSLAGISRHKNKD
jgi:PEP-CTERM motif